MRRHEGTTITIKREKGSSVIAPVGSHDDDALMLLHFCEEHVDVVAAMLLPVFKDGLALIKEQQSIMDLCLPACPCNMLFAKLYQRVLRHCMMSYTETATKTSTNRL